MDHLKSSQDCEPLTLTVPYLNSDIVPYGGDGYRDYPAKAVHIPNGPLFSSGDLKSHPATYMASFVQEWLFFGLLREILGEFYNRSDFVAVDVVSHTGARITTIQLQPALDSLKQQHEHTAKTGTPDTIEEALHPHKVSPSKHAEDILDHALEQARKMDRSLPSLVPGWPEVLLSINVLIESLRTLTPKGLDYYDAKMSSGSLITHHDAPSAKVIGDRLLRRKGWCIHQYRWICERASYSTLHYLATIRRPPVFRNPDRWADHTACMDNSTCVAYNVPIGTYKTLHVTQECGCPDALAPEAQMHAILGQGGIPILRCARDGDGFSLTYAKASPFFPYVAISHLWADGLGNPNGNHIPNCRLKRLYEQVRGVYGDFNKIRKMLMQEEIVPTRLWTAFDNLANRTRLHSRPEGPEVVSIWLDVYCVPTIPRHIPFDDEDPLQRLKTAALNRMPATYAWASAVLVCDAELGQVKKRYDFTEAMARLVLCGRNSRAWTFQEMSLAQRVLLACEGGPRVEVDVGNHYAWSRHREETYFDVVNSGKVYRLERSVSELYDSLIKMLGKKRVVNGVYPPPLFRSDRFCALQLAQAWNNLAHRNTTRHQDALSILANLVDLPAGDVLRLDEHLRMKAILKSFRYLPIGILTTATMRYSDLHAFNGKLCIDEDRWIPWAVKGGPLVRDGREPGIDAVEVRDKGLWIRSSWFSPKNMGGLTAVSITPPPGLTWQLNMIGDVPESHARTTNLRVFLNQSKGADEHDPTEHIILLDHCFHTMNFQRIKDQWDHGRGALLKVSRSTKNSVHATFVCSISFSPCSNEDRTEGNDGESNECYGEICRSDRDVILDCDIASWKNLGFRLTRGRYRKLRFHARMAVLFSPFPLALGMLITIIGSALRLQDQNSSSGLLSTRVGFAIILLSLTFATVAWALRPFLGFLNMYTYFQGDSHGIQWYERLEDMMPATERIIGPRLRFEATLVRTLTLALVWPAKTYCAGRRFLMRMLTTDDEEQHDTKLD